jgi:ESS family glutamate:Na+ symporter
MDTEVVNGVLTLKFNMIQTVALGVVMYYFGVLIRKILPFFVKLSIPASVIGGLTAAILGAVLQAQNIVSFQFDSSLQSVLMIMFFCTVGMNASYKLLMKGGALIFTFWGICALTVILQNLAGICVAKLFKMPSLLGVICGSVSMIGGLGTAGTFGHFFENSFGVNGAMAAGITCAMFGMIAGSALGGPLSEWIIKKRKIVTPNLEMHNQIVSNTGDSSSDYEEVSVLVEEEGVIAVPPYDEEEELVSGPRLMRNISWIIVSMGIGSALTYYFNKVGILLPAYLLTMIVAIFFRNIGDASKLFDMDTKAIGMISDISLAIFVTMAISTLNLNQLAGLAIPIFVILIVQMVLVLFIAYFFVFKLLGKDYESVVMSAGFVGFGLGATPNALANMQTLSSKHGTAVKAFFVVPIVSAFLIDFTNALLITFFSNLFK